MRTTLDLPDDILRRVKAKAALQGSTIKELVTRYVETGLRQADSTPGRAPRRSALPLIKRGRKTIAPVTAAAMARLDQEADRAKLRRSFGR
jgi:hypothetical protein